MTARVRGHVYKQTKADVYIIPGGTTSLLQPADVSWNKHIKAAYTVSSTISGWLQSDEQSLTPPGNMRPPAKLTCLKWVVKAWEAVSNEVMVSSWMACGFSVAVNVSENSSIHSLKQSEIAAKAASRISKLTAEMLAAPNDNNDDRFLSSDDDQDELETNELTVEGTH